MRSLQCTCGGRAAPADGHHARRRVALLRRQHPSAPTPARRPSAVCCAASLGDTTVEAAAPEVSRRVLATDSPVIVKTKALMAAAPPGRQVLSLAQGIVHWGPPPAATEAATRLLAAGGPTVHGYGPVEGLPDLRDALAAKLIQRNGLHGYDVMVTAGANQAFVNLTLALCDSSDRTVLFSPHYFNHAMALQMTGGASELLFGPCDSATLHPDLDWLAAQLAGPRPPRMVVIVNPCNPTGVLLPRTAIAAAASMCAAAGAWLVLDNTYEDFVYDAEAREELAQPLVAGPNVVHVFSFSKAYGMMGWRVGYIAHPKDAGLGEALAKVQDTIPICPSQLSQHVALAALTDAPGYVEAAVRGLHSNKSAIADALVPLGREGDGWVGGRGAIYYWARLPSQLQFDDISPSSSGSIRGRSSNTTIDELAVEWLIAQHGVCIIPGTACGAPGHVRVAFANLRPDVCEEAAARLRAGLTQLASMDGPEELATAAAAAAALAPPHA